MQAKILGELLKNIKVRFDRLQPRQKALVSLLIFAFCFSLYFNKLLRPQIKQLSSLSSEMAGLNRQLANLKIKMPSLEKERAGLIEMRKKQRQYQEKLAQLEKELPGFYRIPELLGNLAKQAQDLEIDFYYIKPKTSAAVTEGEYWRLDIEMQFSAPYADFQSYLTKLERISAYLNVTDVVIESQKESNFAGEAIVTMVLSTLLRRDSEQAVFAQKEKKEEPKKEESGRNLFVPSSELARHAQKSKYVLSGITSLGENSTAIINDEVYKEGDLLENKYPIKQILPNMVVIKHGGQTEVLMLE